MTKPNKRTGNEHASVLSRIAKMNRQQWATIIGWLIVSFLAQWAVDEIVLRLAQHPDITILNWKFEPRLFYLLLIPVYFTIGGKLYNTAIPENRNSTY